MRQLKSLLIFCFCLTLLATSATGAFARGQMAFGQTLLICAEGEPVSITLDARGNPIDAAHPCPECLAITAGLPPDRIDVTRPFGRWARLSVPVGSGETSQTALHAFARGPPGLI